MPSSIRLRLIFISNLKPFHSYLADKGQNGMTSSKIFTNKINWNVSIFMTSLLIQKHNDEDN
jgi:hypothetical protein